MVNLSNPLILTSVVFGALLVTGCGGGGDSSSKDLFSLWNSVDDNTPLELTGGTFSRNLPLVTFFPAGEQCNCDLTILGTQSSGSYIINSCTYLIGSGTQDPGCNAINDTGNYSKTSDTLTTTNSTQVVTTYK